MTEYIEVHTQAELDAALARPNAIPVCMGAGRFTIRSGSPSIVAGESSSPSIEARESSSPSIVAWGSSSPSIVARGSSSPSIVAWGSSSPSIEAWGSSSPSIVVGRTAVAVLRAWGHAKLAPVIHQGGQLVALPKPDIVTGEKWCAYHGVTVTDGVAVLFKALDDRFRANHNGFAYEPGSVPVAPDWDGGHAECGGGLHFSPTPGHARAFFPDAKRFVACPVRVGEIVVHPDGMYPAKVKAPGCCAAVWEVDRLGDAIAG